MQKKHVRLQDEVLFFDYPAKHGKRRIQAVIDPEVADVVGRLKRRRGGGDELLAYKRGRNWHDIKSADINAWLKQATGEDISAKDFRTWGATVLAAVARAVKEVARYLGNTPAVARASYIDPRVLDRFADGETIYFVLVTAAAES